MSARIALNCLLTIEKPRCGLRFARIERGRTAPKADCPRTLLMMSIGGPPRTRTLDPLIKSPIQGQTDQNQDDPSVKKSDG